MTRKTLSYLAAVALLAVPAAAAEAKSENSESNTGGTEYAGDGKAKDGKAKKCEKPRRRGFTVNGTFASYADPILTVDVRRANKHARVWLKKNAPAFSTVDARVRIKNVTDGDGNGTVDLADGVVTDRIKIRGKLIQPRRGCEGDTTVKIKKIKLKRPDVGDDASDEGDGSEAAETS